MLERLRMMTELLWGNEKQSTRAGLKDESLMKAALRPRNRVMTSSLFFLKKIYIKRWFPFQDLKDSTDQAV